ncbi:MAG: hypothetical protein LC118_15615 [Dehalococcoidia bacterium]|nr:hypothetical protein [Dehalococcoidia bacterium]
MSQAFYEALKRVLAFEGGFSDHPLDKGGATNRGITQKTFDAWNASKGLKPRSVRDITMAEVEAIYWQSYWLKAGCDQLPPALAFVVFDTSVNSGAGRALGWLAETRDWRVFLAHRLKFLTGLETFNTFGRGWTRRVAAVQRYAAELDTAPATADRVLVVFDETQKQIASVPLGASDLLVRVRGSRVYVRPDDA